MKWDPEAMRILLAIDPPRYVRDEIVDGTPRPGQIARVVSAALEPLIPVVETVTVRVSEDRVWFEVGRGTHRILRHVVPLLEREEWPALDLRVRTIVLDVVRVIRTMAPEGTSADYVPNHVLRSLEPS